MTRIEITFTQTPGGNVVVDRQIVRGFGDLEESRHELDCAGTVMVHIGSIVARYSDFMNMRKGVVR